MQVKEKLLGLRRTATTCSFVLYILGMKSPASDQDMDQMVVHPWYEIPSQ